MKTAALPQYEYVYLNNRLLLFVEEADRSAMEDDIGLATIARSVVAAERCTDDMIALSFFGSKRRCAVDVELGLKISR